MNYSIRKGEKQDLDSVLQLITELAIFEKEPNAVEITVEDLLNDGFGKIPAFKFYVAELEGEIVGIALFYERYSTWKGRAIHLEDLIVTQKHRGKGIGKALYDSVLGFALQKGVKRVAWEVLSWNTPAIEFYKSTGALYLDDWNVCQISDTSIQKYLGK
ncbi:MAG TPA: GNAT family N-acetyltransferase [Flavobacteriaceae bacterium]|jgi:GNAT superfamily N-acetyltransferase|nr:GNAT family N-acetyltransferase [Flavobacteriaceae bacterium]